MSSMPLAAKAGAAQAAVSNPTANHDDSFVMSLTRASHAEQLRRPTITARNNSIRPLPGGINQN